MTQQLPGSGQIWTPPNLGVVPGIPVVGGPGGADWTPPQQAYLDALVKQLTAVASGGIAGNNLTGANGMQDADFVVPPGFLKTYVGSQVQFSLDRHFTLPAVGAAQAGTEVTWADEVAGSSAMVGGGAPKNLIANTADGKQIMGGALNQTGGTTLAATYTATFAAWGAGATITFHFNGVFWKVI